MVIYPSFQMIRYGNCVWVEIFDVSQIKVKLEKTEGGAWRLGKVVDPDELKKIIPYSITYRKVVSKINISNALLDGIRCNRPLCVGPGKQ